MKPKLVRRWKAATVSLCMDGYGAREDAVCTAHEHCVDKLVGALGLDFTVAGTTSFVSRSPEGREVLFLTVIGYIDRPVD